MAALKEFYPYIYGFPCQLITDHNPLTSLKGLKDVGGRLSRWMVFLQQFELEIVYKPGKKHSNSDALSRTTQGEDPSLVAAVHPSDNLELTRLAQNQDAELAEVIEMVKAGNGQQVSTCNIAPGLRKAYIKNGVLCRMCQDSATKLSHTQLIVPRTLKATVLTHLHNQAGHLGMTKTLEKIKERYYWPGYQQDTEKWIRECDECQRRNPPPQKPRAPLGTLSAKRPFEKITWDIMGPLPTSARGNVYILMVTDVFTKWVEAFPLRDTVATNLARILVDEIICRYGVPDSIHSDQGSNFGSEVMQATFNLLGMNRTRTTAYHPMGNGQVERFNRTVEAMLAKMVKENQRDWDSQLPKALFAYRTAVHESTGFTPYHLNFGRTPMLPIDVLFGHIPEDQAASYPQFVQDVHRQLHSAQQLARRHLEAAHQRQKKFFDQKCQGEELRVGDRVWLYCPAIKPGRTKKFACLWKGPYTITDKTGPVNYRIQLIGGSQTVVVHRNRLKMCYSPPRRNKAVPSSAPEPHSLTSPPKPSEGVRETDRPRTSARLFSDVVAGRASVGGYTSSSSMGGQRPVRPQRNHHPPVYFGTLIPH